MNNKYLMIENRILLEIHDKSFDQVTELILDNCRATDISALTDEFVNLRTLSLINVGLASLKGFPILPNLNSLDISDNRIVDTLGYLCRCTKLKYLNAGNNQIKDWEAITPLKEFQELASLNLYNNQVTKIHNYRQNVLKLVPSLKNLDYFGRDEKISGRVLMVVSQNVPRTNDTSDKLPSSVETAPEVNSSPENEELEMVSCGEKEDNVVDMDDNIMIADEEEEDLEEEVSDEEEEDGEEELAIEADAPMEAEETDDEDYDSEEESGSEREEGEIDYDEIDEEQSDLDETLDPEQESKLGGETMATEEVLSDESSDQSESECDDDQVIQSENEPQVLDHSEVKTEQLHESPSEPVQMEYGGNAQEESVDGEVKIDHEQSGQEADGEVLVGGDPSNLLESDQNPASNQDAANRISANETVDDAAEIVEPAKVESIETQDQFHEEVFTSVQVSENPIVANEEAEKTILLDKSDHETTVVEITHVVDESQTQTDQAAGDNVHIHGDATETETGTETVAAVAAEITSDSLEGNTTPTAKATIVSEMEVVQGEDSNGA